MIDSLITSNTRIKLLKKFFLNSNTKAHLRGLETEFRESSNGIRIELNRFENAGLLESRREGNRKIYQANKMHPLYNDLHSIIIKETGLDQLIEKVITKIGNIGSIYLTGQLARGNDSPVIDLILVGGPLNQDYLDRKIKQAEELIVREVKYKLVSPMDSSEELSKFNPSDILLIWDSRKDTV